MINRARKIVAIEESYNPREIYNIVVNKEQHHDSHWLSKYYSEQQIIHTNCQVPFAYNRHNYELWLEKIYQEAVDASKTPHYLDSGILPDGRKVASFSNKSVKEHLFQKQVQNSFDTAFLGQVGSVGPCDYTEGILQKIKYEESGCGDYQQNHCNVYRRTLENMGFELYPVENLADDKRLLDDSFADVAFQLCIGRFPSKYKSELLGMTLYLEWAGTPEAFRMVKLLKKRNIDSTFYLMHVTADNPKNGHANDIKNCIPIYLETILSAKGEQEMQREWQKIYQGYVTWDWINARFEYKLAYYLLNFERGSVAA